MIEGRPTRGKAFSYHRAPGNVALRDALDDYVPLVVSTRSGHAESVHYGAAVGLDEGGNLALTLGNPNVQVFGRSSWKPIQAAAMVRLGLMVEADVLAVVASSHSGAIEHVSRVQALLSQFGLSADDLRNPPEYPFDPNEAEMWVRRGWARSRLTMNCSGKHAGMLATCVVNGWPTDSSYVSARHPLQGEILEVVRAHAREFIGLGVDGCGAPAYLSTLVGLAHAFRNLATGAGGEADEAVYAAVRGFPMLAAGAGRVATTFMQQVPDLIVKDGAEGVLVAACPDGRAVAVKIADGGNRAARVVLYTVLEALGFATAPLMAFCHQPVLGGSEVVGAIEPITGTLLHGSGR